MYTIISIIKCAPNKCLNSQIRLRQSQCVIHMLITLLLCAKFMNEKHKTVCFIWQYKYLVTLGDIKGKIFVSADGILHVIARILNVHIFFYASQSVNFYRIVQFRYLFYSKSYTSKFIPNKSNLKKFISN